MKTARKKPLATASVVVGVLAILLALLADEIGLGDQPGFNWKQAILLAVGVAVMLFGIALLTGVGRRAVAEATEPHPRRPSPEEPLPPPE